jgi:predicted HAD superfamily Cof-like phosphohydrolase
MKQAIQDVAMFHAMTDTPINKHPWLLTRGRVNLRWSLIDEEVNKELKPAMEAGDMVGIADGIVDSIYVLIGAALEYGIPLEKVWDAVQTANMAKRDPVTGKVRRREDGKILKPEGWQPPNIWRILHDAA